MKTTFSNEEKAKIFHDFLGERFKSYEVASPDSAPISFVATDHEGKEYYIYLNVAEELSIKTNNRDQTGIMIENAHFYHLYGMISQNMNVFWMECFNDGWMLFYLNDCCSAEQLNVLTEQTLIGVTSALHVEIFQPKQLSSDGKTYTTLVKPTQPTVIQGSLPIQGSPVLGRVPKTRVSKRKK
jgi:hypothetical protein